jgi:hypothetical protein
VTADKLIVSAASPDAAPRGESAPLRTSVHDLGRGGVHVRSGEPDMPLPHAGTAVFYRCGQVPSITIPLDVKQDGTVTFPAPANCESLVLGLDPFGPLTFARSIQPVTPQWLGEFTLHAAGAAGARVVTDDDAPVADATVTVYARTAQNAESLVPLDRKSSGADGWVHFGGLPAARELAVIAEDKEGGRSATERLRVQARGETTIDRLLIPRPASLTVTPRLDPQFLAEFPAGRIEAVVLQPSEVDAVETLSQPLDGKESVEFTKLRPGRWRLTALISSGQGLQPIEGEGVDLESGEAERIAPTFKPLVFRGRVTARGKGVEGMIDIRGSRRSDIVPAVRTSANGEFTALLVRPDVYQVDVRTQNPARLVWIGEVPFTDPARPVEIAFPDTEIAVTVRAGKEPAAGVIVSAQSQRDAVEGMQSLQTGRQTDARGEARLEGLLPGPWVVSARGESPGDAYAEKNVLVEAGTTARVELELTAAAALTGTVREAFGAPVAGATVDCVLPAGNGTAQLVSADTGDDGTFSIGGNSATKSAVFCSVNSFAGSQGYRVTPGQPVELLLSAAPAGLRVLALPRVNRLSTLWLVSRDGRLVHVSSFIGDNGTSAVLEIPALAPEAWSLVRVSSLAEWTALANGGASTLPRIGSVSLEAGQRKTIDLATDGGQ